MEQLIKIITELIKEESLSEQKIKYLELLFKAEAINIIKPHAEAGVGFALESISRIAASSYNRNSDLKESVDDLARILSMYLEKNDKNNG